MNFSLSGCIAFCFFLFSVSCSGQEKEIVLKRYSTSDGLPDNSIRCLYFDSKGFLWAGTEEGIARFDGEEFVAYGRNSQRGKLSGNVITDIKEDEEGWLWLATQDGGICRFNPLTNEVFHPVLPAYGGSEQNLVYALWLNPKGGMVVGTDKGIYISKDRKNFQLLADNPKTGACYAIKDYGGKAYTAEVRFGCRQIDTDFSFKPIDKNASGSNFLNTVYIDKEGTGWIGAWNNYLYSCNISDGDMKQYNFLPGSHINASTEEIFYITEAFPGKLWLALKSGQLWEFDKQTHEAQKVQISPREYDKLYGNKIQYLYTDSRGRTWIGTNNGLHLYDEITSRFEVKYLDEKITITAFARVQDKLFAGGFDALYQIEKIGATKLLSNTRIYSMLSENDLRLMFGTISTVKIYSLADKKIIIPLKEEPQKFPVNNIGASRYNFLFNYNTQNKKYLFANAYGNGLVIFDDNYNWDIYNITTQEGIDNLLNGMFCDSKNRLWIFGSLTGLINCTVSGFETSVLNYSKEIKTVAFNRGLQSKHITSMVELNDNTLWVSTLGGGLYRFYPDNKEAPFEYVNSPYQSVKAMIKDNNDNLWMIASGMLMSYNPAQHKWTRFDERAGIPREGLNGVLYKDNDGSIYAGGDEFYLHFDPNLIIPSNESPRTQITHLKVQDKQRDDLLAGKTIRLPYNNNYLTIDFTSLCFSNASASTFKYKLKGADKNWRDNGQLNSVSYSALSPGKYEFLVKASSAEGLEDTVGASLLIEVPYPFYFTWWFILLIVATASIIIWLIIRARKKQRLQLELIRNKIARDLHDDIGSALGSISFFSETAKRTLESNHHQNTTLVLDKIGSTSREMIENMHDIVWAVNPLNDEFDKVILRMKNYATDLAASNDIHLQFEEKGNLSGLKLSMTERKNLFLIFKEALYNSAKYSGCTTIRVSISNSVSTKLQLTISDNGIGFDIQEKQDKGNGLKNMNIRAKEIGAKLTMESGKDSGTTVAVAIF